MIFDEKSDILGKMLNKNLDKAYYSIINCLKTLESFNEFSDKINSIISSHILYKHRDKVQHFAEIIQNSKYISDKLVIELKEQSEMRSKRKKEAKYIKKLIKGGNLISVDNY